MGWNDFARGLGPGQGRLRINTSIDICSVVKDLESHCQLRRAYESVTILTFRISSVPKSERNILESIALTEPIPRENILDAEDLLTTGRKAGARKIAAARRKIMITITSYCYGSGVIGNKDNRLPCLAMRNFWFVSLLTHFQVESGAARELLESECGVGREVECPWSRCIAFVGRVYLVNDSAVLPNLRHCDTATLRHQPTSSQWQLSRAQTSTSQLHVPVCGHHGTTTRYTIRTLSTLYTAQERPCYI